MTGRLNFSRFEKVFVDSSHFAAELLKKRMHKKDYKDSHARVCLSRLTRLLDMDILEDLQQLEYTGNVTRNLEIVTTVKAHRSFFSKSTEKLNKIMSRKGT